MFKLTYKILNLLKNASHDEDNRDYAIVFCDDKMYYDSTHGYCILKIMYEVMEENPELDDDEALEITQEKKMGFGHYIRHQIDNDGNDIGCCIFIESIVREDRYQFNPYTDNEIINIIKNQCPECIRIYDDSSCDEELCDDLDAYNLLWSATNNQNIKEFSYNDKADVEFQMISYQNQLWWNDSRSSDDLLIQDFLKENDNVNQEEIQIVTYVENICDKDGNILGNGLLANELTNGLKELLEKRIYNLSVVYKNDNSLNPCKTENLLWERK